MGKIQINLVSIRELNFTFPNYDENILGIFNPENLYLEFAFSFEIDENKEIMTSIPHIRYSYKTEDIKTDILQITVSIDFKVSPLFEEKKVKGKELSFSIPQEIFTTVISESLGTIRGIIHSKTYGSFLNTYPVPMYNPENIFADLTKNPEFTKARVKKES